MKKLIFLSGLLILTFSSLAVAQRDDSKSFEELLEADAKHNLAVAWQYFKMRKAYIAVLNRTEETIAAHPSFSKMDEVLYLTGMSSYYLYFGKGSQKIVLSKLPEEDRERFTKEKLKEDAMAYLTQFVDSYPDSKYVKRAKKALAKLEKNKT